MDLETLRLTSSGAIATLWLNRPERRNAFSPKMATELVSALAELAEDDEVRVVVLRGTGGHFCSGGDLAGDAPASDEETRTPGEVTRDFMNDIYGPSILALHHFPKPVLAAVEGIAAGAGMNLALACDVVYAAEGARFCEIFVRRSLSLDCGGSWLLPRLVGIHKAKELLLLAEIIDAKEAGRIGIVNRVVPELELDAFVDDSATRLAAGPPLALQMTKRMTNSGLQMSLSEMLHWEAMAQTVTSTTKDGAEAMNAFLEKRPPHFKGR